MAEERLSDEILAVKAKEGDRAAFEELFNRYKKPLLNFIYRLIGSRETAEEVAQEVFIKVYKNLDIFDATKRFASWLYTIARNLTKNAIRDKRYFRDVSLEQPISGQDEYIELKDVIADTSAQPDTIAQDEELAEQAQQVLNTLPLEYREVITLCSIQALTYEEAAKIIGCSIATVSTRLNKARILFMKKLGLGPGKRSDNI